MLILSRKEGESIVINDNITIKVVSIDKGVIKLGIDAPSDVTILRLELAKAVTQSNKAASFHIDASILSRLSERFKR